MAVHSNEETQESGSVQSATDRCLDASVDDDSDYIDSDFATLHQTRSQQRRAAKDNCETRLRQALPWPFSPNIRPLTISDLDSCVALENAAFTDQEHRASSEKIKYRLTTSPELSLGLFSTVVPSQQKAWGIETLNCAKPVETARADQAVSVLLAHIVATRCCGEVVTDSDMAIPDHWASRVSKSMSVGHQESGRTVALHSVAVLPKLQGCGLGKMIVKAYLQQITNSDLADRIALLCQDYLISYYERCGFKNIGESKAEFGGGGWYNMILELSCKAKPTA